MTRITLLAGLLLVASRATGQSGLFGPGQYPQFRSLSGLSGGGYALRSDGSPGFDGAMAFSTPIGYSLSDWHFAATGSTMSDHGFFRLPNLNPNAAHIDSNSKLNASLGASLGKFGSLTGGVTLISAVLDTAFNLQYQVPWKYRGIGLSAGVQDIVGKRTDRAENVPNPRGSRSFYAVATLPLADGIYASGGWGDRRFEKGFASLSAPVGNRVKVILEHDGFAFNEMVAFDMRLLRCLRTRRTPETVLTVGYIRGQYAFFALSAAF